MSEEITNQEKIELGSRSKEIVQCGQCGKDLTVEERNAFEGENGNDIYFCDDCINQIRERFDKITKNLNMPKAFLFSFVTAIVCGLLYGLSIYLTITDFGFISIGVAYLIALTACKGAGDKRGIKLQVLSIILTLVAIFVAQDLYMILKVPQMQNIGGVLYILLVGPVMATTKAGPIGLLIWAIGLYTAYIYPKAPKI